MEQINSEIALLQEVKEVLEKYNNQSKNYNGGSNDGFNIFEVQEIIKEVPMCRFLTAIINPKTWDGDTCLLRSFMKKVLELKMDSAETYSVVAEYKLYADSPMFKNHKITKDRRVDIVIIGDGKWIPIEAKIHAKDMTKQCTDDVRALQSFNEKNGWDGMKMFYLTAGGVDPDKISVEGLSEGEKKYIQNIGWMKIAEWLSEYEKPENSKITDYGWCCIQQYIGAVKTYAVNKKLEEDMEDILVKNMRIAKEIYANYNNACKKVMKTFFEELDTKLMETVNGINEEYKSKYLDKKGEVLSRGELFSDNGKRIDEFYKLKKSTYPSIVYLLNDQRTQELFEIGKKTEEKFPGNYHLAINIEIGDNLRIGLCFPCNNDKGEERFFQNKQMPKNGEKSVWEKSSWFRERGKAEKQHNKNIENDWWLEWVYVSEKKWKEWDKTENNAINFNSQNEQYFNLICDDGKREKIIEEICNKFESYWRDIKKGLREKSIP